METILRAHRAGVGRVLVGGNVQVPAGAVLFLFDTDVPESASTRRFAQVPSPRRSRRRLRGRALGLELPSPAPSDARLRHQRPRCRNTQPTSWPRAGNAWGVNDDVSSPAISNCSRSSQTCGSSSVAGHGRRVRPARPQPRGALLRLPAVLRPNSEGLPAHFVDDLGRALAHYGVARSSPTPLCKTPCSGSSSPSNGSRRQVPVVIAMLERLLAGPPPVRCRRRGAPLLPGPAGGRRPSTRFPVIADVARELALPALRPPHCWTMPCAEIYLAMDAPPGCPGGPARRTATGRARRGPRRLSTATGPPAARSMPDADETHGAVAPRGHDPPLLPHTPAAALPRRRRPPGSLRRGRVRRRRPGVHLLTTACPLEELKEVADPSPSRPPVCRRTMPPLSTSTAGRSGPISRVTSVCGRKSRRFWRRLAATQCSAGS